MPRDRSEQEEVRVPPAGRNTVLFTASTPLSYAVLAPIARGLAADRSLDLVVTGRHGGEALARECLGVPFRFLPPWIAKFKPFSVALCPGFFFHSFRRGGRLVQVFHGVSPKNYAVAKEVRRFDRLYVIGEYHRQKFERAGIVVPDDPRVVRVGMPKTDPLLAPNVDRSILATEFDLDPTLPVVAYAPTRSGSHGSSIDTQGLAVLDALAELPINLIVKLHDRSQQRFRSKLEADHEAAIEERARQRRIRLWRGFDVIPLLRLADVLLSDLSSVTGEFLLRDRPIVFLSVPKHEKKIKKSGLRRFGDDPFDLDWLRATGETADTPNAARSAVVRALESPESRGELRRERANILFYNPGRAAAVAVAETHRLVMESL